MRLYSRIVTKAACIMLVVTVRAGSDALQQIAFSTGGLATVQTPSWSDTMAAKKGRKAAKKGGRKAAKKGGAKKGGRKAAKKGGRKAAKKGGRR